MIIPPRSHAFAEGITHQKGRRGKRSRALPEQALQLLSRAAEEEP
jgi:hypothetical protein